VILDKILLDGNLKSVFQIEKRLVTLHQPEKFNTFIADVERAK